MSKERSKKCGLYFLLNKGNVIYIGQTTNLYSRMGYHNVQKMPYDCMRFIPCPADLLDYYKARWIKWFLPSENTAHKGIKKQKSRYVKSERKFNAKIIRLNDRNMKFRKLTKKSMYGFGTLKETTVDDLLTRRKKPNEVIWVYYSLSHISYVDELLDELKITEEWRIPKPGIDYEKGKAFLNEFYKEEQELKERKLQRNTIKYAKNRINHDHFASNNKTYNMVRNRKYK